MTDDRPLFGIAYFCAAILLTAIVDAISKLLTSEMHALQIVWGYFVGTAFCVLCYAVVRRLPGRAVYGTSRVSMHVLRVSRTRFPWTQNWLNRSVQGGPEHDR